jgi:hypothetical protein
MAKQLTKTELAHALHISKSRVTQLVAAGLPIGPHGIDLDEAKAWVAANIAKLPVPTVSFEQARTEDMKYRAGLARLKFLKRQRELIDAQAARQCIAQRVEQVRARLDKLVEDLTPQVTAETDKRKIHAIMRSEIRRALEELSITITPAQKEK